MTDQFLEGCLDPAHALVHVVVIGLHVYHLFLEIQHMAVGKIFFRKRIPVLKAGLDWHLRSGFGKDFLGLGFVQTETTRTWFDPGIWVHCLCIQLLLDKDQEPLVSWLVALCIGRNEPLGPHCILERMLEGLASVLFPKFDGLLTHLGQGHLLELCVLLLGLGKAGLLRPGFHALHKAGHDAGHCTGEASH